jgi:hypothetical protein
LPITKDRPTSVGVDLDIGAVKDTAHAHATDQGGRNSHGDNQGVGARVGQPVLSHVLLFMLVQKGGRSANSWGRRLHAALSHTVTRSRTKKKSIGMLRCHRVRGKVLEERYRVDTFFGPQRDSMRRYLPKALFQGRVHQHLWILRLLQQT